MNFIRTRIFFRVDGNSQIGLGHVVRCIALAEILREDFDCTFIIKQPSIKVSNLISQYCNVISISEWESLSIEATAVKTFLKVTDILILDGYQFNEGYEKELKPYVKKLVVIDDLVNRHFYADLIINNCDASIKSKYNIEIYTKLLLGFPYLLLRKPFRKVAKEKRILSNIDTIFICMGGADPFNLTVKILEATIKCDFVKNIIIVTGSAYEFSDMLSTVMRTFSKTVTHHHDIDAEEMVDLLKLSQIAICTASSIALEVCCVKAGLLIGTVIDNQEAMCEYLTRLGCSVSLGNLKNCTHETIIENIHRLRNVDTIKELINNQSLEIDGLSDIRLLNEFKLLAEC